MSFRASQTGNNLRLTLAIAFIVDLPFLAVLFLTWDKPNTSAIMITIVPITITGLLIYLAYLGRKMEYILEDGGLYINFPASPLRVRYDQIRSVDKVDTSLSLRLFGGSLPGVHWGLFSVKNLGNLQVYSTKHKGDFVLIELSDKSKLLLSPLEPDAFVNVLREKIVVMEPIVRKYEATMGEYRTSLVQVAAVTLAWLSLVAWIASIYPALPEIIPVHFGLNGVPNRWGSKNELLWLAGVATIFPILNAVFVLKFSRYNRGLVVFLGLVFLLAIGLFAVVVNQMIHAI